MAPPPRSVEDLQVLADGWSAARGDGQAASLRSSRSRAPRLQLSTTESWSSYLRANAPVLVAGAGAAAFVAFLAYRVFFSGRPAGRAGRKGRRERSQKLKVARDPGPPRQHGLIDDPNTPRTPVGLRNVGNSCFLNALLQALQSSEPFLQYVIRLHSIAWELSSLPPNLLDDAITRAAHSAPHLASTASSPFERHIVLMRKPLEFLSSLLHLLAPASSGGALDPLEFYNRLVSEASGKFRGFDQQDAHELLHVLLDLLERQAEKINGVRVAVLDLTADQQGFDAVLQQAKQDETESERIILAATAAKVKQAVDAALVDTDKDEPENGTPTNDTHNGLSRADSVSSDGNSPADNTAAAAAAVPSLNADEITAGAAAAAAAPAAVAPSPPSPSPYSVLSGPAFQFPSDPFKGLLSHFLICGTCATASSSIRHAEFNSLTLNFGDLRGDAPTTVEEMLRAFVKTEQVDGVRCENCNWHARRALVSQMMTDATPIVTKGPKSARKKAALLDLLRQAETNVQERLAFLQPTSGAFLQQQRQAKIEAELRAMQNGVSVTPLQAADSSPPSDGFLNSQSPTDPLLKPAPVAASSTAAAEFFSALTAQLRDEEFCATLPDSFVSRLASLCAVDTKCSFAKGSALARLPPAVCLHLNRLVGGAASKVRSHVAFPLRLSLYRYTAEWTHAEQGTNIALSATGRNAAKWGAQRIARSALQGVDPEREAAMTYELDAVVVHQGGGSGGHYVAYRRQVQRHTTPSPTAVSPQIDAMQFVDANGNTTSNTAAASSSPSSIAPSADGTGTAAPAPSVSITWWYISDAQFHQVDVDEVLRAQAYLLVYTRATPQ